MDEIGCTVANQVDVLPVTHVVFDGDTVRVEGRDGENHSQPHLTFRLDAKYSPRRFDIFDGEELESHGLYRIKGGSLILCLNEPDRNRRPTGFCTGEETWLLDLERE